MMLVNGGDSHGGSSGGDGDSGYGWRYHMLITTEGHNWALRSAGCISYCQDLDWRTRLHWSYSDWLTHCGPL